MTNMENYLWLFKEDLLSRIYRDAIIVCCENQSKILTLIRTLCKNSRNYLKHNRNQKILRKLIS